MIWLFEGSVGYVYLLTVVAEMIVMKVVPLTKYHLVQSFYHLSYYVIQDSMLPLVETMTMTTMDHHHRHTVQEEGIIVRVLDAVHIQLVNAQ